MQELQGKTILLLAPKFFGYELEIKRELKNIGTKVIYFDERSKNDFFTKVFIRLNLKVLIKKKIYEYYNNIIKQTKNTKLDYLFLVAPETINEELINKIKSLHPNLEIYIYMWDSVKNKKNGFALLSIADKFFTFDPSDIKINQKIQFLPLFYIDDYKNLSTNTANMKYDISFVGTVHSDRYPIIKKLEKDFKVFHYFYSPSKLLFKLQRLLKNSFKNIDSSDIHFESFKKDELLKLINESKAVIDIEHPDQKGLTMRTMEMVGAKKKLITTNINVKEYDFYTPENICIIDRKNPIVPVEFFESEYKELPQKIFEKYALRNWLMEIFKQ